MSKYFVISTSEDGDVYFRELDKTSLLEEMTPDEDSYAELKVADIRTKIDGGGFINLQDQDGIFIIKGELVAPQPVKVVKTFDIE